MAEDPRIVQDTLADATNARHLENLVHVAHVVHGPLQGLDHIYVGKGFYWNLSSPDSYAPFVSLLS
jgi:hypothetical protein